MHVNMIVSLCLLVIRPAFARATVGHHVDFLQHLEGGARASKEHLGLTSRLRKRQMRPSADDEKRDPFPFQAPVRDRRKEYGSETRGRQSGDESERGPGQPYDYRPRPQSDAIETFRGQKATPGPSTPPQAGRGGHHDPSGSRLNPGPQLPPGYRGEVPTGGSKPQIQHPPLLPSPTPQLKGRPPSPPSQRQPPWRSETDALFESEPEDLSSTQSQRHAHLQPPRMSSRRLEAHNPGAQAGRVRSRREFEPEGGDGDGERHGHPPSGSLWGRQEGERVQRVRGLSSRFYHTNPTRFRHLPHGQSGRAFATHVIEQSRQLSRAERRDGGAGPTPSDLGLRRAAELEQQATDHAARWRGSGGRDHAALEAAYVAKVLAHTHHASLGPRLPRHGILEFHALTRLPRRRRHDHGAARPGGGPVRGRGRGGAGRTPIRGGTAKQGFGPARRRVRGAVRQRDLERSRRRGAAGEPSPRPRASERSAAAHGSPDAVASHPPDADAEQHAARLRAAAETFVRGALRPPSPPPRRPPAARGGPSREPTKEPRAAGTTEASSPRAAGANGDPAPGAPPSGGSSSVGTAGGPGGPRWRAGNGGAGSRSGSSWSLSTPRISDALRSSSAGPSRESGEIFGAATSPRHVESSHDVHSPRGPRTQSLSST